MTLLQLCMQIKLNSIRVNWINLFVFRATRYLRFIDIQWKMVLRHLQETNAFMEIEKKNVEYQFKHHNSNRNRLNVI